MNLSPLDLILLSAATIYLSYVVTATDGPFGAFLWLRTHVRLGGLTSCVYCLAPWVALALYLCWRTPVEGLHVLVLALGAAGLGLMSGHFSGMVR